MEHSEEIEVPRMEPEKLRTFIKEVRSGSIFLSLYLNNPKDIPMVFMPLALGGLSNHSESYIKSIGAVWEYYSKAGPMSINGMPMFMSCHLIHQEDVKIVTEALVQLEKQEEETLSNVV